MKIWLLGILFLFVIITGLQQAEAVKINVDLSTSPQEPISGETIKFKIDFINPNSQKIQEHVDYRFTLQHEGKNIFGPTPLIHTSEGSVTIPVEIVESGTYLVLIEIEGILFQPIPTEIVNFDITIEEPTPEDEIIRSEKITIDNMKKISEDFYYASNHIFYGNPSEQELVDYFGKEKLETYRNVIKGLVLVSSEDYSTPTFVKNLGMMGDQEFKVKFLEEWYSYLRDSTKAHLIEYDSLVEETKKKINAIDISEEEKKEFLMIFEATVEFTKNDYLERKLLIVQEFEDVLGKEREKLEIKKEFLSFAESTSVVPDFQGSNILPGIPWFYLLPLLIVALLVIFRKRFSKKEEKNLNAHNNAKM